MLFLKQDRPTSKHKTPFVEVDKSSQLDSLKNFVSVKSVSAFSIRENASDVTANQHPGSRNQMSGKSALLFFEVTLCFEYNDENNICAYKPKPHWAPTCHLH